MQILDKRLVFLNLTTSFHLWSDSKMDRVLQADVHQHKQSPPCGCLQANGTLNWAAEQAQALILEVLQTDPQNPLALHLHIHLVEATSAIRWARPTNLCSLATLQFDVIL